MKHISIIVSKGAILGNIEGPRQVFTEANQFLQSIGKQPLFDVHLVGLSDESKLNEGLYTISTESTSVLARLIWLLSLQCTGICRKQLKKIKISFPG